MIRLVNLFKPYPSRLNNALKILCAGTEVRKVNLSLEYDKDKDYREKSRKRNYWKFKEYSYLLSLLMPLGISIAACDSYLKHNEKRFFRAVLYGLEDEVQR